jgi:hypothetical protein
MPDRPDAAPGLTWWVCVVCKQKHQPQFRKNAQEIDFLVCSKECRKAYVERLSKQVRKKYFDCPSCHTESCEDFDSPCSRYSRENS